MSTPESLYTDVNVQIERASKAIDAGELGSAKIYLATALAKLDKLEQVTKVLASEALVSLGYRKAGAR